MGKGMVSMDLCYNHISAIASDTALTSATALAIDTLKDTFWAVSRISHATTERRVLLGHYQKQY